MEHSAIGGAVGGANFSTATRPGAIQRGHLLLADEEDELFRREQEELLRLQQEEYDRVFADEDGHGHRLRRHRAHGSRSGRAPVPGAEAELLRLQQEEYDRVFADE